MSDVSVVPLLEAGGVADVVPASVNIPSTPVSPGYAVSDIPTVTLPFTKATKSHIAAAVSAVIGAAQLAVTFLPESSATVRYISAGISVVSIGATWLGVYVAPNLPKITKQ